jgi:hypothetical protein
VKKTCDIQHFSGGGGGGGMIFSPGEFETALQIVSPTYGQQVYGIGEAKKQAQLLCFQGDLTQAHEERVCTKASFTGRATQRTLASPRI